MKLNRLSRNVSFNTDKRYATKYHGYYNYSYNLTTELGTFTIVFHSKGDEGNMTKHILYQQSSNCVQPIWMTNWAEAGGDRTTAAHIIMWPKVPA